MPYRKRYIGVSTRFQESTIRATKRSGSAFFIASYYAAGYIRYRREIWRTPPRAVRRRAIPSHRNGQELMNAEQYVIFLRESHRFGF